MRLFGFVKSRVLGGAIFLVPMIVIIVLVGKALQLSMKVAAPLAAVMSLGLIHRMHNHLSNRASPKLV